MTGALLSVLRDVVGPAHVVIDADVLAGAVVDWTGRFRGSTPALVRPGSTGEVAGVVRACRSHGATVCLQGGNTGLVGGSVPLHGEVLVSLARLTGVEVDPRAGQAHAGAGCTIGSLHRAAAAHGWTYGVDVGSRDSATVGGTVATNAGGMRMMRYGDTRAQLLGAEAVLGDGTIVSHLPAVLKDNTGYNLAGLLCGSEGTLGVVTAARLRLAPSKSERATALLGFGGLDDAVDAAGALGHLECVEAIELMCDSGVQLVCTVTGLSPPLRAGPVAFLLVDVAASSDPSIELGEAVGALRGVRDSAVALEADQRARLWRFREAHSEAVNTLGAPHKLDVSVPLDALAAFIERVPSLVAEIEPGARAYQWGHAGDGNVHVNVAGLAPDDDRVDGAVLGLAVASGGSISAEHGIGTAKRRWLSWARSPEEIAAFRALKRALDPDAVLNPAVLLP